MARARWGGFIALGRLDAAPFADGRVEAPEVVVVVEGALLGRGEFAAEQVDAAGVAAAGPGMAASREGAVGAGGTAPVGAVGVVDVEVVEEGGEGAVEVFAAEEEEFVAVCGRAEEGGRGASGGRVTDYFGDLQKLLLLFFVGF